LQQFGLKQHPVTYVASAAPDGATSTLRVWVDDVEWHEVGNLSELGPTDRRFVTRIDEDETTVVFGTGERGARLPTGSENVRARYRSGIGAAGNVAADQLTLLATRPLGVKGVVNPLRASGGADPESRDQARRNAPLAVLGLDRLVSVSDFADFARTFAGVGKASASRLSNGHRELVHVTIAGADDAPVDEQSELMLNLRRALRAGGDPFVAMHVEGRELLALVLSAKVAIAPDYEWDVIASKLRAALLRVYGFEQRELGEDAVLSRIIQTMHAVDGVRYVDVDVFGAIAETIVDDDGKRRPRTPPEIVDEVRRVLSAEQVAPRVPAGLATFEGGAIRPAQIAYFLPGATDTLILNPVLS